MVEIDEKQICRLAEKCTAIEGTERPELQWLREKFLQIQKKYQLKNKKETDTFLYRKMYGKLPEKESDLVKIRFWRTGKHMPANREQCIRVGQALELSENDMQYLIQGYYDHSLEVYHLPECLDSLTYQERYQFLSEIIGQYLARHQLDDTKEFSRKYLRHQFYQDAFSYVYNFERPTKKTDHHIDSSHYDSEFTRQMKLLGEIPRRTMIRNLLIFGMPNLTLEKLNDQLKKLGYFPITDKHTLAGGERLDLLLIHIFELYEKVQQEHSEEEALLWFQKASRILDHYFVERQMPRLQIMFFKALSLE